jgi:flagellar biosynthesis protein FlhF
MAEVRSFQGKTIAEVMEKVRASLGPEAMILTTRKLEGRGGLVEIMAMPGSMQAPAAAPEGIGAVKSELMSLREMIVLLNQSGRMVERLAANPVLLSLYAALIRGGVNDEAARHLFEKGGALGNGEGAGGAGAKKKLMRGIMGAIEVNDLFEKRREGPVIAAFLGTTGVGKTTTIAKLAARLLLKEKKKVGLISIDGYRIGAMEQLRIYANILGIPCFPAFCRKDLRYGLKRLWNRDVILIDTAGQSHYDREKIETLRALVHGDIAMDCHLLLPVGMNEREMDQAARNFQPLGCRSYIFTKVDESRRCGAMLNQILRHPLPISYVTTGQSVPEDIEKAEKAKLLNLILNGN